MRLTRSLSGLRKDPMSPNLNLPRIGLVVADMAGTMADFGSSAPAAAFVELFRRHEITATDAEAREPMGLQKRDHVEAMLSMESIAGQWQQKHGTPWTDKDVDALYAEFIPLQLSVLPHHSTLIPGVKEAITAIQNHDVRVAGTTGYNREMMDVVVSGMRDQGLHLDAAICAEDVASGRPAPWMIFRAMEAVAVSPPCNVVKIGDTLPDIESGVRAGVWSIGVTDTGNMTGCDQKTWDALDDAEREERRELAAEDMTDAGAHYVLASVAQLPPLLDEINDRLRRGERP